jgi:hypothetical protein
MIIKLIFLLIILYILIQQYLEKPKQQEKVIKPEIEQQMVNLNNQEQIPVLESLHNKTVKDFYKPNPWTRIATDMTSEYPYNFYIKIRIPSLNDYEDWKQIIPNLDFNARTGELIIPSKDEASALAIANLISSNFSGNLSLQEILDKNLIQISISKARNYELVQHKFREQIMENLSGTIPLNKPKEIKEFKEEKNNKTAPKNQKLSSDDFVDTFQHYTYDNDNENESINAYDNNGYYAF